MPAGTRGWRGICRWRLPNNQHIPLCHAGKGVEFLRQRAEAAGDAHDLPAVATFVFQLAGIVEDDQLPAIRRVVLRDEVRDRVGHHLRPTVRGAEAGDNKSGPVAMHPVNVREGQIRVEVVRVNLARKTR